MNNIQKRFLLFLIGCIGLRTLFVLASKNYPQYLQYMGWMAIVPAIGFMYIYLTDSRKTGGEVFGESIWWDDLRPVHALLYGLFAYMAINQYDNSWIVLLADVIIGLIAFLVHHYQSNSFAELF